VLGKDVAAEKDGGTDLMRRWSRRSLVERPPETMFASRSTRIPAGQRRAPFSAAASSAPSRPPRNSHIVVTEGHLWGGNGSDSFFTYNLQTPYWMARRVSTNNASPLRPID
jgi:hypothetical protein